MPLKGKERITAILLIAFFIAAFGARIALLEHRPLHHDEGVNGYFISKILSGEGFQYDPQNYHGPTFFFVSAPAVLFLGNTPFALRLAAAFFGSAVILLLFPLRKKLGVPGTATAAFFLSFSASFFYYSIDAIHEILFVFFSIAAIVSMLKFVEEKKKSHLYFSAIFLALLFATKEASFYFGPLILCLFLLLLLCSRNAGHSLKSILKRDSLLTIALAVALFLFVYSALFTSFFSNPAGLADSVRGPFIWLTQPELHAGHEKPFYYYAEFLLEYEFPLLVLGVLGTAVAFLRKNPFFSFFGAFFIAAFSAASIVEYKVPWILINFLVPLAFLAGFAVREIFSAAEKRSPAVQAVFVALLFLGAIFTLAVFFRLNVEIPAEQENGLAYVQTTMHAKGVVEKIHSIARTTPEFRMAVAVKQSSWPLSWLFEDFNADYYGTEKESLEGLLLGGYPVILVEKTADSEKMRSREYESEAFTLRPGVDMIAFYRGNAQK